MVFTCVLIFSHRFYLEFWNSFSVAPFLQIFWHANYSHLGLLNPDLCLLPSVRLQFRFLLPAQQFRNFLKFWQSQDSLHLFLFWDPSSLLPVVQCLKIVILFILFCFLIVYGGRIISNPVISLQPVFPYLYWKFSSHRLYELWWQGSRNGSHLIKDFWKSWMNQRRLELH